MELQGSKTFATAAGHATRAVVTGDAEDGTVVDVSPGGTLAEGDTVTITYYGKAAKPKKDEKR